MREIIKDGFEFVALHYPFNKKTAIKIVSGERPLQAYQEYIQNNGIDQAEMIVPDLAFLRNCPTLKHLRIAPSFDAPANFDFSPLYDAPEIVSLSCQNVYGDHGQHIGEIDYARISGLIDLFVDANKGSKNFNQLETLKSLCVGGFQGEYRNVRDLFCSRELDTLRLVECKIHSLDGIERATKMQCLYLHYNRSLQSIEALRGVKGTLKALRIENCSKIKDFSVLGELENLELLELSGGNTLPNLDFIKTMRNLKTFTFNMNVLSGDLSPCLELSYVYSEKNRKHYNLKDADLPKGAYHRGNDNIEEWRRLA